MLHSHIYSSKLTLLGPHNLFWCLFVSKLVNLKLKKKKNPKFKKFPLDEKEIKMSSDSGPNTNTLLSQFELAYAETMSTLTQEDTMHDRSPDTIKSEIDTKITKFTDLARQMETFFLQKQFLLYAHKPELHLKDESTELRQEIQRKDELIRKHNERLAQWLKMLQDLQQQQRSTVKLEFL